MGTWIDTIGTEGVPLWVVITVIFIVTIGKNLIPGVNAFFDRFFTFKTEAQKTSDDRFRDLRDSYDQKIRDLEDRVVQAEERAMKAQLKYARIQGMLELLRGELKRQDIDVRVIDRYIEDSRDIDAD